MEARLALAAELADILGTPGKTSLPLPADWFPQNEPTSINNVAENPITRTIVPGEITVAFVGNADLSELRMKLANSLQLARLDLGGSVQLQHLLTSVAVESQSQQTLVSLQLGEFQDVGAAGDVIRDAIDGIAWAEPNYAYHGDLLEFTPNDQFYGALYFHTLMQNNLAWDTTLGSPSVIVAVTDNGVQLDHPDLVANLYINPGEIPGNGIDDDGNNFIDDVNGWDFVTDDNDASPATPAEFHGTAVAGVIAARTDNSIGVAGTAGRSTMMPIRILGTDGALTSTSLLNGFRYAADNGARIVNTSTNFEAFVGDAMVNTALQYLFDNNVIHVSSAGNANTLNPARQAFDQTLLVAHTNIGDQKAGFSNYGTGIDVSAPGELVGTTDTEDGYALFSGSSLAAANVSGVAALVWSANPSLTRDQVVARVLGTAVNIDVQNPNYVGLLGSGRVNSNLAINATLAPPRISRLREVPTTANPTIFPIGRLTVGLASVLEKASVETAANWTLVGAGVDDTFGTGDDTNIPLTRSLPYFYGANDVVFTFPTLAAGSYRFTAVSGGLRDPFNTALDGDANGSAGGDFVKDFRIAPGVIVFNADFSDSGGAPQDEGFTSSGPASAWHLSTGRGADPGHSADDSFYFGAGETSVGGGTYADDADGSLTSPIIDLTGHVGQIALEFNHFLASEAGLDIASVNVIEGAGVRQIATSTSLLPANTVGFQPVQLDLSSYAGRSIRLQFRFTSNASNVAEGWYIDDIVVRAQVLPTTRLSGQVWNDLNGNRVREGGDVGLAGWTVYLDGNNNSTLDSTVINLASTDVPRPINDTNVISSQIVVAGIVGTIADLDVTVNITHPYISDLTLILVSPTGFRILLAADEGGDGDNFTNTRFDDEAATSIVGAVAPFTGSFQPEGVVLAAYDGTNPNGVWLLEVADRFTDDVGSLTGWSLHFTIDEASRVTTAAGDYAFSNVPPGTYTIREILQATWNQALPIPGFHNPTVTAGQTLSMLDFANSQGPIAPPTFLVSTMTPTSTGVVLDFNRDLDVSTLNLYDVEAALFGPADMTLVGATSGAVRGSVVIEPSLRRLTFIATVGRLPADTYTVTLRSAANGFRDTTTELLDGDGNSAAGGNYVNTFIVATPPVAPVAISVANFSRGPEQPVHIPANGTSGLPISFSDGAGVTTANFEIRYNPALLNITGATVAPGLTGASVNVNTTTTPGVAVIQFSSPTPLAAGTTRFIDLQATVPTTAPYRSKHLLDIGNIVLNPGPNEIPSVDDDGLHVVAYFGDGTGNGTYGASDASRVARVGLGFDTGFQLFRLLDPIILGDVTGNNSISSFDASRVLQVGVAFSVAEIPPLPNPAASLVFGGPDPKLSIPTTLAAAAGSDLSIPVMIDSIVDLTGNGLESADLVVYYDAAALDVHSVSLGSLLEGSSGEWFIASRIDALAGRIFVSLAGHVPLEGFFVGELVQLNATVKADAPLGASAINLAASSHDPSRFTQLNDGYLTLIPAPTDAANDPGVDGLLTITAAPTVGSGNQASAIVVDNQLFILGTTGADRIFVLPIGDDQVRVRVGGTILGTFATPSGIAIDALTGNDFVYVAPNAPPTVVAADQDSAAADLIFGGANTLLSDESQDFDLGSTRDLALLQLVADWSRLSGTGSNSGSGRILRMTRS